MTMKRTTREMTWYMAKRAVKLCTVGDKTIVVMYDDVDCVIDDCTYVNSPDWNSTEYPTWEKAVAYAEKIVGQTLREGHVDRAREAWSDGVVTHGVQKHAIRIVFDEDEPRSHKYSCTVSSVSPNSDISITKDQLADREEAIQIGRDLVPIVRAALQVMNRAP